MGLIVSVQSKGLDNQSYTQINTTVVRREDEVFHSSLSPRKTQLKDGGSFTTK